MKELTNAHPAALGTKAANLYRLRSAGVAVPEFSVLGLDAYDQADFQAKLYEADQLLASGQIDQASYLLRTALDEVFKREERQLLQQFSSDKTYSVRSSATVEDGEQASFAGQFETFLQVSAQDLFEAVVACFSSLYSPSALTYFARQGLSLVDAQMAVIVQEMVVGHLSGVYFTANPLGILNQHLIVFGEGIGDGVVEDKVPTTTVKLFPEDHLMTFEQSEGAPLPSADVVTALSQQVHQLLPVFGPYLDVEFACCDDQIWFLQVRPITGLSLDQPLVLDNSNIVESYPGVSSPLTVSFVKEAYHQIFKGLVRRLGGQDQRLLAELAPVYSQMVTTVNSHFYYQINNWYHFLHFLPLSKQVIPIWQDMLGVRHLSVPEVDLGLSLPQRWGISWRLLKAFMTSPYQMAGLAADFEQIEADFAQAFPKAQSIADLRELYEHLACTILANWEVTLINDLYAFVYTGLLKKVLPSSQVQAEIAGIEAIESMKPALAIQRLRAGLAQSEQARQDLATWLAEGWGWQELTQSQSALAQQVVDFLRAYGDRAPEELKLETQTFKSHPALLFSLLSETSPERSLEPASHQGGRLGLVARFLRKRALRGIAYRESSRLNRSRIYGMVRAMFRQAGVFLVADGWLKQVEDVFFLTKEEIFEGASPETYADLVAERQGILARNRRLALPRRFVFSDQVLEEVGQSLLPSSGQQVRELTGTGCSPGRVTGEVLVVTDIRTVGSVAGKILVTKMTDPGWVYALLQAKGVIAEQGSLLSHTAIISRELGIPALVNVKQVTSILQTGELIEMDGQTGQIIRKDL